jgi:hypothetical protein
MYVVKWVEFVSDKVSYIILRCRRYHIIVLDVHAPTEDKIDYVNEGFYDELECVSEFSHSFLCITRIF